MTDFRNRETTVCNYWITNDYKLLAEIDALAKQAGTEIQPDYALADLIQQHVRDWVLPEFTGLAADLQSAAEQRISYLEIARRWLDLKQDHSQE